MKPINQDDYRSYDLAAAMDGEPYGMKNGMRAEVAFWDMNGLSTPLLGRRQCLNGEWVAGFWHSDGIADRDGSGAHDLVMWPLDYCQGIPVFSGDTLVDANGQKFFANKRLAVCVDCFDKCTWPHKEPVMPRCSLKNADIEDDEAYKIANLGLSHALKYQLDEVIDYLVESGKVVRVQS